MAETLWDQMAWAFGDASVTYAHSIGGEETVTGVFNRSHVVVDEEGEAVVTAHAPTLRIRISDLSTSPVQDDEVTIDGTEFRVVDVQEDGDGFARLELVE
jgi:hypothetical protein